MKKITCLFLLFLFFIASFFSVKTLAQENLYFNKTFEQQQLEKYSGSATDVHKTRHDATTLNNMISDLTEMTAGMPEEVSALTGYHNPGAIGSLNQVIIAMVNQPPVNTGEYLADISSSIGLPVKTAHAQGIGFRALNPVLEIWKGFRNVVYILFVFIFILIGFMIMFRAKINPQTVVTIEAALPKIVITLLLVTFSYAIAGLMVDLIYIILYFAVGVFSLAGLIVAGSSGDVIDLILTRNPFTFVYIKGENILISGPAQSLQNLINDILGPNWDQTIAEATRLNLVGELVKLILSVAVLFSLFKLFFSLLMSYLGIILSVIFAPFQLLFNALPGNNAFLSWLKNLFANIIVFPAVAILFMLAAVLVGPFGENFYHISEDVGFYPAIQGTEEAWVPPFLVVHEGQSGPNATNFQALIALGMIMMAPQVVTMIKKALKVEGTGIGGAIVGGIMAGPAAVGGVASTAWGLQSQITSMRTMKAQRDYSQNMQDKIKNAAKGSG
jgi:hypothetical protein